VQVNFFNRLANREFLVLVAIVASAVTLHVRQQVDGNQAQQAQTSGATGAPNYGRMCEPPAADAKEARMLPAECDIRANTRRAHAHSLWV
jgi:hypothetical protein